MNDANIRWYLKCRLDELTSDIKKYKNYIINAERNIDDYNKQIALLKVHYTSLLNTALVYGYEEDEEE